MAILVTLDTTKGEKKWAHKIDLRRVDESSLCVAKKKTKSFDLSWVSWSRLILKLIFALTACLKDNIFDA